MATDIVLRSIKAAALTHAEMDQNWESLAQTVDAILANYTVLVTDQNKLLECSISSGTITLLTVANAAGTDTDSFKVTIKNINATSLIVAGNGSEQIEGTGSITLLENETAQFTLSSGSAEWNITGFYNPNLVGISATAAELNTLDGITATTTELNYSSGVTSALQTQLNNKQPLDADLTAIAALSNADSNFIVGNGSAWVAETGATARTSLGVDPAGTDNSTNVSLAGTPNYLTIAGQVITRALVSLTSHITGILPLANGGTASSTASGARTNLNVDAAGTDNSTNVSLAGTPDYITIAGQVITRAQIDLTTDVTGVLPDANGGGSGGTEGTFIPTITDSSTGAPTGYTVQVGNYIKLGNWVFFTGYIALSGGTGTLAGSVFLSGLPFPSINTASYRHPVTISSATSLAITAGYSLGGRIIENDSKIILELWDNTAGTSNLQVGELSNGATFIFGGSYLAA